MLYSNYTALYFEDFIAKYAATIGKPVIYFRSHGWNNSTDVDKINQSYEFYEDILDPDVFTCLKNSEYVFVEVESIAVAMQYLEDDFPSSQTAVAFPELYIHYSLFNAEGQIVLSN